MKLTRRDLFFLIGILLEDIAREAVAAAEKGVPGFAVAILLQYHTDEAIALAHRMLN